jgi:hypothetical protein
LAVTKSFTFTSATKLELDKKLDQSCLGALYNQQFNIARILCPMKIINAKQIIYQLNNNRHLVYTPVGQTIPINCAGKSSEKFIQKGSL